MEYIRHSYIAGLHHYLIVVWDDEVNGWQVGIAAMPSKRLAKRYASGRFEYEAEVAEKTNSAGRGTNISWFLRQLNAIMTDLNYKFGSQLWMAYAVDAQRHRVYRHILSKRGWLESSSRSMIYYG